MRGGRNRRNIQEKKQKNKKREYLPAGFLRSLACFLVVVPGFILRFFGNVGALDPVFDSFPGS
jgi:UPF0716 family protein affecting phage T7 exclusion